MKKVLIIAAVLIFIIVIGFILNGLRGGVNDFIPDKSVAKYVSRLINDGASELSNNFNDLPEAVSINVVKYLKQRVGDQFYTRLAYNGGQYIDKSKIKDLSDYQWTVPDYILWFKFSMEERGIKEFNAEVWLNKEGNIIKDIGLPKIAEDPNKAIIAVSIEDAIEIAVKNGFSKSKINIDIDYNKTHDVFVWKIHQLVGGTEKMVEINTFNSEILNVIEEPVIFN